MFLHDKFFCIISWSRPVITIVMKIPAMNCFITFVDLLHSQSIQLEKVDFFTSESISPTLQSIALAIENMVRNTARSMNVV